MVDAIEHADTTPNALQRACMKPKVPVVAHNLIVIALASVVAIAIPQVQVVFGLLGATTAVSQIYIFPGLMVVKLCKSVLGAPASAAAQPLLTLHVMATPLLAASRAKTLRDHAHGHDSDDDGLGSVHGQQELLPQPSQVDCNDSSGAECLAHILPFPTTVRVRMLYGYLLLTVGTVVGVLGTVLTIVGLF